MTDTVQPAVADEPVGPREAVRLAKERLGEATAQQLAEFVEQGFGLRISAPMVTVMLGSLRERRLLEESGRRAVEEAGQQEAPKPKRRRRQGPRDGGTFTAGGLREPKACPVWGGDYAFRGRKVVAAKGESPEMVETKYKCRGCECEWRVQVPSEVVGPLGAPKEPEQELPAA